MGLHRSSHLATVQIGGPHPNVITIGNHQDLIDAITKKLWPLGDDMRFVPGHGPASTFGQERSDNAFVADRVLAAAR